MTHATQTASVPTPSGVSQLLSQLRRRNVRLWVEENRLRFRAPAGRMTPDLIDQLRLHKAEIIRFLEGVGAAPARPPTAIPAVDHTAVQPLAFAQERLWFVEQLQGESNGSYHMSATLRLTGPLELGALEAGFNGIIRRHALLRTTFTLEDGVPMQHIAGTGKIAIRVVDWANQANAGSIDTPFPIPSEGIGEDLGPEQTIAPLVPGRAGMGYQSLITAEASAPFDLARGPLLRALILRLGPTDHLLTVTMHHIISDGWSIQLLIEEMATLYAAFVNKQPDPLPGLPIQYVDYAHWQRTWLNGAWLAPELAYWKTRLAGAPPLLELPTDYPRRPAAHATGGRLCRTLDATVTDALRTLATQSGATLFMTLLAAFNVLLARYSGQTDIVVGTPVAGRNHPDVERLIGFFVNTLPLRTDLAGDPTFRELLARVRTSTLDAFAHQEVPFIKLVEHLRPERNLSHNPFYQVMFAFQDGPSLVPTLAGVTIAPVTTEIVHVDDDLFLQIEEGPVGWEVTWEYNADLFRAETVARMADHFALLLCAIVADPDTPILALPMLTMEEEAQLLFAWNATDFPLDTTVGFHQLFAAQVTRTPDAVAVCYEDEQLTYAELNALADQYVAPLRTAGVGVDSVVALLCDRSPRFLAAAIAIFKAGGAYLPLDVRAPAARQGQVLSGSQTKLLLITEDYRAAAQDALALLPADQRPQILPIDENHAPRITHQAAAGWAHTTHHSPLAYVIYTSGSTGLPKGAMVEQRGMINHLYAKIKDLAMTAADTVAQTAPQSFDISVWQFFAPLILGGRVHIIPDEVAADPVALLRQSAAQGITVLEVVPSLLRMMVDALAQGLDVDLHRLRWMIPTGEALPPNLARQWLHLCPQIPLVNAYGPTECSDDVTHYVVTEPPAEDVVNMPIGRPIINMRLYILDPHRRPVPVGVAGELYVGGIGVGRGYIHDPDRTEHAFVPDPFRTDPQARLYKTGDKARYLPDGTIEYLGRLDYQVKIRGFRIELGEIEATLERHPAIHQAVVMDQPDPTGNRRLIAYVVATLDASLSTLHSSLRNFLGETLPDYMVPAAFVLLDAMPLTPNGKVDRKALPVPDTALWSAGDAYVAPETALQTQLVALWGAVLKLDPDAIGIEHNFFALGGHSLLAVQIIARVRNQWGVELPIRTLLEQPTVAGMAAALQTQLHGDGLLPSVVDPTLSLLSATTEPTREVIEL